MLKPIHWLVLLLICACCVPAWATYESSATSVEKLLLLLNNTPCGYLKRSSGGGVRAEIKNDTVAANAFSKYHIEQPVYEPLCVEANFGFSPALYNWIAAFWDPGFSQRQNVSIVSVQGRTPVSERKFGNAIITETTIPACDTSCKKDAGNLTVTLNVPYAIDAVPGKFQAPAFSSNSIDEWIPANFKLEVDGLDCTEVTKIDSFTIKRSSTSENIGEDRVAKTTNEKLVFPNLHIALKESGAATWKQWADDFIIKGKNQDADEKNGRLIFLTGGNKPRELARIEFKHLGIFRLAQDGGGETIRQITAGLYCEQMVFVCPGTGENSAAQPEEAQPTTEAQPPTEDGQLGTVYNMGGTDPLYFCLKSAEFTTSQVIIGTRCFVPSANEKLLRLNFTVQNPNKKPRLVRWDSLSIAASDEKKIKHSCGDWGTGANSRFEMHVDPDQTIDGYTVITMPAKGPVNKLTVQATDSTPLLGYDLRDKVSGLSAPIAEPEDSSGATAREIVPGEFNTAYPYNQFDVAVGKYDYTTSPILGKSPQTGGRFLVVTLHTTNKSMLESMLRFDTFKATLISTGEEPLEYGGNLLVATADRSFDDKVQPGAKTHVRIYFYVPEGCTPETLTLQEGKSREYAFKIAN